MVFFGEVGEELFFVGGVDECAEGNFEGKWFGAGAVAIFALAVGAFVGFVEFAVGEGTEGIEVGVDFK